MNKNVTKNVNAPRTWMTEAKTEGLNNTLELMEYGDIFNGQPGPSNKVRAIILDEEPITATTKTGLPVWNIQVMRISSHQEQRLGILKSITQVTDQLVAIAEKNDGNLKEIMIEVEFIKGSGPINYIRSITQIHAPKVAVEALEVI